MAKRDATASSPPLNDDETTTNPPPPGGSSEGFEQPLPEPEVLEGEEPDAANVDGTAALGVKLMNIGCAIKFNAPLTTTEEVDLHRDLAAVLRKYDAPDFPYMEEVSLVANVGGIVFRRVAAQQAERAAQLSQEPAQSPPEPPKPKGAAHDMSRPGQEGFRQNRTDSQAGGPRPGGEAGDLLS